VGFSWPMKSFTFPRLSFHPDSRGVPPHPPFFLQERSVDDPYLPLNRPILPQGVTGRWLLMRVRAGDVSPPLTCKWKEDWVQRPLIVGRLRSESPVIRPQYGQFCWPGLSPLNTLSFHYCAHAVRKIVFGPDSKGNHLGLLTETSF